MLSVAFFVNPYPVFVQKGTENGISYNAFFSVQVSFITKRPKYQCFIQPWRLKNTDATIKHINCEFLANAKQQFS